MPTSLIGRVKGAVARRLRESPRGKAILRRLPGKRVRWGNLRRTTPFGGFGFERGEPIDRRYIGAFLSRERDLIRGEVLEVKDPSYTRTYGGERVTASHVVDVDPGNPAATIVADLCAPGSLPEAAFDTILFTQVLQFLPDPDAGLRNLWAGLRPGGAMLVTVPCMSRLDVLEHALDERPATGHDLWRWTPAGLDHALRRAMPGAEIDVEPVGNALTALAFTMGLATEDLRPQEIDAVDPYLPVLAFAVVRRPQA